MISNKIIFKMIMNLNLQTPTLLFSATSLILLAYTNRFIAISSIVRGLKKSYDDNRRKTVLKEIENLNFRIQLMRLMQLFGVKSLFLSVFSMFLIFINLKNLATILFGISLFCLLISLGISVIEINISVKALKIHLSDLQLKKKFK